MGQEVGRRKDCEGQKSKSEFRWLWELEQLLDQFSRIQDRTKLENRRTRQIYKILNFFKCMKKPFFVENIFFPTFNCWLHQYVQGLVEFFTSIGNVSSLLQQTLFNIASFVYVYLCLPFVYIKIKKGLNIQSALFDCLKKILLLYCFGFVDITFKTVFSPHESRTAQRNLKVNQIPF